MDDNAARLLLVLQSHAPSEDAREVCARMVRLAIAGDASSIDIEKLLASALLDGLQHGNWPWVFITKSQHTDRGIMIGDHGIQINRF